MIANRSLGCALGVIVVTAGLAPAARAAAAVADARAAVERGEEAYARGQLQEALAAYQAAQSQDATHVGALCGLARVAAELAEETPGEGRRRLIAAAVEHARAAVKVAPEQAGPHVWLAVALGQQAGMEGLKTRAALWREIKSELDRALGIDPGIARAYLERGRWHRRIASRGLWERTWSKVRFARVPRGASLEGAVRDFEKAVELAPEAIEYRLELARTYVQLERHDDARRHLERAVAMPAHRPRDPGLQGEARELLEKLAKRG